MSMDLLQLRKNLRQQRRRLSPFQQRQAEHNVWGQLKQLPEFKHAQKIGIYLHAFGELQTDHIIKTCFQRAKQVYLPIICPMNQKLRWVRISAQQYRNRRFHNHRLGMQEPRASRSEHVTNLDLLLLPLLACDKFGTRIGMGGGYYDRTLADAPQQPLRVGLAHDFQYLVQPLQRNAWDQPLDQLITPAQHHRFKRILMKKVH